MRLAEIFRKTLVPDFLPRLIAHRKPAISNNVPSRFDHLLFNFFFPVFFFFKQKTAYEIASCLVGSEMCIRDS